MPTTSHSPRNKQAYVIKELTRMAGDFGPGMKLPTAQKLAKQLGVTLTTLDRSLAKLESKGVINRRQGSGIYVSSSLLDQRIGLVFGRNIFQFGSSAFYLLLLQHCERTAEAEHKQFCLFLSPNNRKELEGSDPYNPELAAALKQGKLDGLILCDINDEQYENWIASQKIPAVALFQSKDFPAIGINTEKLIEESMAHLAAKGCQSVGLLGILSKHLTPFTKAASKHGLEICQEAVLHPEDETDPPFDTHEPLGREWMQTCLKRCGGKKGLPDGLIITDDILARGALLHLKENGIRPGKDLHIVSHANKGSLALEYWQDQITLAEVDPEQMVEKMFKLLESKISGKKLNKKPYRVPITLRPAG